MNNPRTLSGVNNNTIQQLNLPSTIDAILIDGNPGERGQVLAKNETTNKLEWDKVDDISIPENSISGDKLKTNITFSTTGLIRANEFFSNYFIVPQNGAQQVILDSDGITMVGNLTIDAYDTELRIDSIICSGNGGTEPTILVQDGGITLSDGMLKTFISGTDAVRINNGGDIALYSDNSQNLTMRIDANSGNITIFSNGKIQTYGVDEIMRILNGGNINFYSDNAGNTPTLEISGSNGQIEMKGGGNLELKNGGDIEVYDSNDVKRMELVNEEGDLKLYNDAGNKTFDINGATGDLKIYNPTNGNEKIELDGTTGNVIIYKGGRIDMFDGGGDISIELNGANGIIDCEDINVLAHTGIISFDNLRCNTFSIPKTSGADFSITSNSMSFSNPYTISGGSSNATFKTLVLNGGTGVADSLVINGNTITGTDIDGNDGSITMNTGDLTITTGELEVVAGNSVFRGGADFVGDNSVDIIDSSSTLQFRLNPSTGDFTVSTGDLTITAGELEVVAGNSVFRGGADFVGDNSVDIIDSSSDLQFRLNPSTGDFTASTGDITATAGDIISLAGTLRSDKVGSKPAPIDSSSYTDWALSLADTNSHAFIGGNLICNGTIYANVEGTITEEIIDAQRLNLRADPSGDTGGDIELNMNVATGLNGRINQTYDAVAGTGGYLITTDGEQTFEITKNGNINRCHNIIMRGDTFNNFNSANFLMGTDNALISSTGTGASSFDRLTLDFGSSSSDSFINVRSTNVNRVVINKDGIDFNDSSTARLSIDSNTGDINFNTTVGAINGHSSTTPNALTNMTMFSVSNQLPHPRFVQICDPATHSTYTLGNGVWYNMAGYTDNNSTKPRFTNADLSFTAFSTTGRINVIFSASVGNNMGVRFRIVEINGVSAGIPITGTQRLFIGSSAHRGQHEYTCYYAGFTIGYEYVIAPEIYVGGTSNITMYVGSYSGSATIQDADSPIITEIAFMNRSTFNIGNLYVPPSGEDY